MNSIESAIKDAVEKGGYIHPGNQHIEFPCNEITFLDPAFWQALGKARGWGASGIYAFGRNLLEWEANWHRFVDHLASGGTSEDFFKEL